MVPFRIRLRSCRRLSAVVLLGAACVAQAQPAPERTVRADPLDAAAPVPAAPYASPLAGYRRLGDDERVPWGQANETVNRIGGWRAYAREAAQPDATPATPAPGAAPGGNVPGDPAPRPGAAR
jgi:hypothetical protein